MLAERLGLVAGVARLELMFTDGRLDSVWTHQRLGARALVAVDESPEQLIEALMHRVYASAVCDECEVGGGRHTAGCSRADSGGIGR